ncbi:cupin domain-containing protein [Vagococcus elongatus]|uniref:Cupin n=1 Tax=Vagococcus elongatus TaxID=180344 RepID=A0A430B166_9ENTE|nr:cupin domain-containing protein [Vagococcus elongatus]RSU14058.1 cupin [Vagococcus elongatus]
MSVFKQSKRTELYEKKKAKHPGYKYSRRDFINSEESGNILVSFHEIEPLNSAYPFHYHLKNEEVFYIISGFGTLQTLEGTRPVSAGDILYFPPNEGGAHKLFNDSKTERLIYIDFSATHDLDVTIYPESKKLGIWSKAFNKIFKINSNVDYFEGE